MFFFIPIKYVWEITSWHHFFLIPIAPWNTKNRGFMCQNYLYANTLLGPGVFWFTHSFPRQQLGQWRRGWRNRLRLPRRVLRLCWRQHRLLRRELAHKLPAQPSNSGTNWAADWRPDRAPDPAPLRQTQHRRFLRGYRPLGGPGRPRWLVHHQL